MADTKYGFLYTHQDVLKIAKRVHEETLKGKKLNDIAFTTDEFHFPRDEPLFTFRAKDSKALGPLRLYRSICENAGLDPDHLENIDRGVVAFENFRRDHPDLLKEPD